MNAYWYYHGWVVVRGMVEPRQMWSDWYDTEWISIFCTWPGTTTPYSMREYGKLMNEEWWRKKCFLNRFGS